MIRTLLIKDLDDRRSLIALNFAINEEKNETLLLIFD